MVDINRKTTKSTALQCGVAQCGQSLGYTPPNFLEPIKIKKTVFKNDTGATLPYNLYKNSVEGFDVEPLTYSIIITICRLLQYLDYNDFKNCSLSFTLNSTEQKKDFLKSMGLTIKNPSRAFLNFEKKLLELEIKSINFIARDSENRTQLVKVSPFNFAITQEDKEKKSWTFEVPLLAKSLYFAVTGKFYALPENVRRAFSRRLYNLEKKDGVQYRAIITFLNKILTDYEKGGDWVYFNLDFVQGKAERQKARRAVLNVLEDCPVDFEYKIQKGAGASCILVKRKTKKNGSSIGKSKKPIKTL